MRGDFKLPDGKPVFLAESTSPVFFQMTSGIRVLCDKLGKFSRNYIANAVWGTFLTHKNTLLKRIEKIYVRTRSAQYIRRQYTILLKIQNEKHTIRSERNFENTFEYVDSVTHVPNQITNASNFSTPIQLFENKNCGR